jgi:exonuclease III
LQETKLSERSQLTTVEAMVDGYHAFFSISKARKGYSGVVTYTRIHQRSSNDDVIPHPLTTPLRAEEGFSGLLPQPNNTTSNNPPASSSSSSSSGDNSNSHESKIGGYEALLKHFEVTELRELDSEVITLCD